ncbi:MAG TPA: hypothetical protein VLE03_00165 [Nitrospiraceae bacterium]|nr:hypothetical protein [Nitrospiraceae bacterium]
MTRDAIAAAWAQHCGDDWPRFSSPNQGQLMTLDTVISGCVVFFLDSPEGLDQQRVAIVKDCLGDLDDLTGELDADSQAYFLRLRQLGEMLLVAGPQA